jgi:PiT family inorganic phosphate transporter
MPEKEAQAALSDLLRRGSPDEHTAPALARLTNSIDQTISNIKTLDDVPGDARRALRSEMYLVNSSLAKLTKGDYFKNPDDRAAMGALRTSLDKSTTFIPTWVKAAVALALGLGTMVGWKRIVVTVGEKIGKVHLTYAQGASAELVAMATIEAADMFGLPVSTTHVLSSGIAGTMFANHSGLQKDTIRNILLAWILTLPVCVFLGASLFAAGLFVGRASPSSGSLRSRPRLGRDRRARAQRRVAAIAFSLTAAVARSGQRALNLRPVASIGRALAPRCNTPLRARLELA